MKKVLLSPFQYFIKIESLSGFLLISATVISLVWANSPLAFYYHSIWEYEIGINADGFEFTKPLILWINDGLMAIFFFLIGLEIKRELILGELNSIKKAAFPFFGAIGGMAIPAILFLVLNQNPGTQNGWGIPMATDIAFSLAILNLLGKRVPLNLKIFLTAFAIVDDVGAVIIIALFYSENLSVVPLFAALVILAIMYILSYYRFYSKFLITVAGIAVWFLFLKTGIHPTLAGILMAFSVPIRQTINTSTFMESVKNVYDSLKKAKVLRKPMLSDQQLEQVNNLEYITDKFRSPLQRLENVLHGWVAYFIIPIFAFANAGIDLKEFTNSDQTLIWNLAISLVLGKGLGVSMVIILAKKLKWIKIPDNIQMPQIIGVSFLAGIGFTMAIFIGNLAFTSEMYLNSAKMGILIGSVMAAILGYIILRYNSPTKIA